MASNRQAMMKQLASAMCPFTARCSPHEKSLHKSWRGNCMMWAWVYCPPNGHITLEQKKFCKGKWTAKSQVGSQASHKLCLYEQSWEFPQHLACPSFLPFLYSTLSIGSAFQMPEDFYQSDWHFLLFLSQPLQDPYNTTTRSNPENFDENSHCTLS